MVISDKLASHKGFRPQKDVEQEKEPELSEIQKRECHGSIVHRIGAELLSLPVEKEKRDVMKVLMMRCQGITDYLDENISTKCYGTYLSIGSFARFAFSYLDCYKLASASTTSTEQVRQEA